MADEKRLEERLHDAVAELDILVHGIKAADAWREFGEVTQEEFWRLWPDIRGWGEWVWQLIENERKEKAAPVTDPELDETGEGG